MEQFYTRDECGMSLKTSLKSHGGAISNILAKDLHPIFCREDIPSLPGTVYPATRLSILLCDCHSFRCYAALLSFNTAVPSGPVKVA